MEDVSIVFAADALQKLDDALQQSIETQLRPAPNILIYFDEAHTLYETALQYSQGSQLSSLFDVLSVSLDLIHHERLAITYISTASRHMGVTPDSPSQRPDGPFSPFIITQLSFDFGPELPLRPERVSYDRDALSEMSYLASFGRPLYVHIS